MYSPLALILCCTEQRTGFSVCLILPCFLCTAVDDLNIEMFFSEDIFSCIFTKGLTDCLKFEAWSCLVLTVSCLDASDKNKSESLENRDRNKTVFCLF